MTQETASLEDILDEASAHANESADVQRYIVAPAMLEMIGPPSGREVLDLFCGAGYLSRRLACMGARVTAVDNSERLVGIAREIDGREKHGIKYAVAEPTDLSVIEDSTFDDVICNMGLMMTGDLAGTVAELARMVKLGGRFIFSVLHPCFSMPDSCWAGDEDGRMAYKTVDNYYAETWWPSGMTATVRGAKGKIKHRTLSTYLNALSARGFTIRRAMEPRPSPDVLALRPQLDIYNRLPVAMVLEAVFPFI